MRKADLRPKRWNRPAQFPAAGTESILRHPATRTVCAPRNGGLRHPGRMAPDRQRRNVRFRIEKRRIAWPPSRYAFSRTGAVQTANTPSPSASAGSESRPMPTRNTTSPSTRFRRTEKGSIRTQRHSHNKRADIPHRTVRKRKTAPRNQHLQIFRRRTRPAFRGHD